MRIIRKTLSFLIAAVAVLTSCKQDDTLQYNNFTMGNVVDGTFTSDQGNIFNVVEKTCTGDLEGMKRAIMLCDVLKKVEGTDNVYDIRLNGLQEVLLKDHITKNFADADAEASVNDPINIENLWFSGGYMNLLLVYEMKRGSTQKHLVNLVLDEEASSAGKYVFNIRHNSFGESLTLNENDVVLAGAYASFPMNSLIKEESADITIKWKWYRNAGQGWSSEVQENSFNITYTKGGFEQAPATFASKTPTKLN